MKKVILVGDSIRGGYEDTVRRELSGLAEVRGAKQNGGNSRNVLANLDEWVISQHPDVVHLNCGLHDIRRELGSVARAVPIDEYEQNVRAILSGLQAHTTARIIWASSTPVNEAWHHERKGFDRMEADVTAYNSVAARVATELGVQIDDLYALVEGSGRDALLVLDGVHFSEEGYAFLGQAVARFIMDYL